MKKKLRMKDKIERMCIDAGLAPTLREDIGGHQLFVADGFSLIPAIQYRRFGIKPGEFPSGCFVTIWWLAKSDERFDVGAPLMFEPNHDPSYDVDSRKQMRVNSAREHAREHLEARAAAAKNRLVVN